MSYNPINWVNGETPINDTNLNYMDQGIADAHSMLAEHESKIDDFVNQQLPEEYVKEAVDTYVENNSAGFATAADLEEIESQLDSVNSEVDKLSSEIVEIEKELVEVANVDIPIMDKDYLLNADGTFMQGAEEAEISEYMEVNEGEIYLYRGAWYVANRAGVCCYDFSKKFISVLVGSEQVPTHKTTDFVKFEIPQNAKYIVVASNNVNAFPLELKKETHFISYLMNKEKEVVADDIKIGNNNLLPLGNKLESERVVCVTKPTSGFASGKIESPVVFWDSKQLKYGMTFSGYGKDTDGNLTKGNIGIAWSDDLETWEVEENPLFTESNIEGSADFGSVTGGFVYVENGVYYLFYIGCSEAGYEQGVKSICLAYGTDIYNLQRYSGNPLVSPTGGRVWTSDNIYKPSVYKISGKYYMFFNAQGWCDNDAELFGESIGYATSEDLFNWEVSTNSVLKPTKGNQSAPDGYIVGDASLYDIGDENIYMAYFAFGNNTSSDDLKDWIAYTSKANFPIGWIKYGKPITPRKGDCKPSIIYRGGVQYHFCGANGNELVFYKAI